MKKGFSLIELIISLIIISIIIRAFAPIMTKRLSHKAAALSKSDMQTNCTKLDNKNRCLICTKDKCILCAGQLTPLKGYYIDSDVGCDYKACPNNCASCDKTKCLSCIDDNYELSDDEKSCIVIDPCKEHNAILIENADKSIRFCMKKINAGDPQVYSSCKMTGTTLCTQDDAAGSGFSYSGCQRIICGWTDANNICSGMNWKLPSNEQLTLLGNIISSETTANKANNIQKYNPQGLQLCDNDVNFQDVGSPICQEVDNLDSDCLWSSTPVSSGVYYNYCLNKGRLNQYKDAVQNPRSTRCILEL